MPKLSVNWDWKLGSTTYSSGKANRLSYRLEVKHYPSYCIIVKIKSENTCKAFSTACGPELVLNK